MKKPTLEEAKKFAEEKFKGMEELQCKWNILHAKYMIKALEELAEGEDISKFEALAWLHDIGKIEGPLNHAENSLKIAEQEFELDEIEKDCILNHGSNGKPKSNEAKIFQCADGLSLFYPEAISFRFYAEAKEGLAFEEVKEKLKKQYDKYIKLYADRPAVVQLIKKKYQAFLE